MNLIKLERREKENNKDYVYRTLYQSIIYNYLYPNEIVSETELQEYFSMSRSPIREALSILTHLGLLEVNPHRSTVVAPLNENIIRDTAFLRTSADKFAIETCIKFDDLSPLVQELNCILDKVLEYEPKSQLEYIKHIHINIDESFHDTIYRYAGFVELSNILKNTNTHYSRFRVLYLKEWISKDLFFNNHMSIVNLLKKQDKELIDAFYFNRLDNVFENIQTIKLKYPNYFVK